MHEGILVWHEGAIAAQYFSKGELVFTPLQVGQYVHIFQNGSWHEFKVISTTDEPYFEDCNYGNCLGCDIKIEIYPRI